jgi:septum formation topological specificity factor MinE
MQQRMAVADKRSKSNSVAVERVKTELTDVISNFIARISDQNNQITLENQHLNQEIRALVDQNIDRVEK